MSVFARSAAFAPLAACTLLADPFEPVALHRESGLEGERAADAGITDAGRSSATAPVCSGDEESSVVGSDCSQAVDFESQGSMRPISDAGLPADGSGSPGSVCPPGWAAFGAPELVSTGLVSNGNLFGPALSADGLRLYFSVSSPGSEQIYTATRQAQGTAVFSDASELGALNSPALEGSPFESFDGRRIYFFSNRRGGVGNRDLWFSEHVDAAFSPPALLGGVNTQSLEHLPWLARDELSIIFVSSRPMDGDSDLWRATRVSIDAAFGAPVVLTEVNSVSTEGRLVLSSDGLTALFSSNRSGSVGDADLWTASRADVNGPFSAPSNLTQLNSAAADLDVALSSDERELFFASSRTGVSQIWRSTRDCS